MFRSIRQTLSRPFQDRRRLELDYRESWTSATLQRLVRHELGSPEVIVVSNREPYVHDRDADGRRHVQVPARRERMERMRLLRRTVRDNSVYRWAGHMLMDVAQARAGRALPAHWRALAPGARGDEEAAPGVTALRPRMLARSPAPGSFSSLAER